jgi:hypothetical protein
MFSTIYARAATTTTAATEKMYRKKPILDIHDLTKVTYIISIT